MFASRVEEVFYRVERRGVRLSAVFFDPRPVSSELERKFSSFAKMLSGLAKMWQLLSTCNRQKDT